MLCPACKKIVEEEIRKISKTIKFPKGHGYCVCVECYSAREKAILIAELKERLKGTDG